MVFNIKVVVFIAISWLDLVSAGNGTLTDALLPILLALVLKVVALAPVVILKLLVFGVIVFLTSKFALLISGILGLKTMMTTPYFKGSPSYHPFVYMPYNTDPDKYFHKSIEAEALPMTFSPIDPTKGNPWEKAVRRKDFHYQRNQIN